MKIKKVTWEEVPMEEVNPKMQRRMIYGEKVMVARMKFKDGFLVPLHHHENEQITQVISGTMRFWFGEDKSETTDLHAGDIFVIPPNVPHEALMIGDVEEMDTFSPPRQDWIEGTDNYLRK